MTVRQSSSFVTSLVYVLAKLRGSELPDALSKKSDSISNDMEGLVSKYFNFAGSIISFVVGASLAEGSTFGIFLGRLD